jgi:hypothetical protein
MSAPPVTTFTARIDKTRPYKLAMPPNEDAARAAMLVFQYLDDGEFVRVPNVLYNQTPGMLAHEMRMRQAECLRKADDAMRMKGVPDWQREFGRDNAMRQAQDMADRAKVYDDLEQAMCCGYLDTGLPPPDHEHLARTREALDEYLATKPARDAMRDEICDPASCRAWEIVEQQAEVSLQYAYFFDTSDERDREESRRVSAVEIFNVVMARQARV